jgi:hypothetical protein
MKQVVVLGGTGRLGAEVVSLLVRDRSANVLVLSRRPPSRAGRAQHVPCDIADAAGRRRCATSVVSAWRPGVSLVIVDCVLDRSSARAMTRATRGACDLGLDFVAAAAAHAVPARLVVCSTTAVLAPPGLGTPYATAKRRALRRYARSGAPLSGLLLPVLHHRGEAAATRYWHAATYSEAARMTVEAVSTSGAIRELVVPDGTALGPPLTDTTVPFTTVVRLGLRRVTVDRNVPEAHRVASRALLARLPSRLRARVDHHVAPADRVRRLAARLGCELRVVSMTRGVH